MNGSETTNGSLYAKILSRDGTVALIAFATVGFLMTVVYRGQQQSNDILADIKIEESRQTQYQIENNEILKDIRYSLKATNGITFRNQP